MNNRTSGKQKQRYIDSKSGRMVYLKSKANVLSCVKLLQSNLLFKRAVLWYNLEQMFLLLKENTDGEW